MTSQDIKPAATILLLRDAPRFEVLMVKRHHQIDCASGALVFPGGKSHAGDHDPAWAERALGWSDFDAEQRGLRIAAIREVFEEAGIRVGAVGYVASQPWPFPASLMLACHGIAESREIAVDAEELEDARWVSRETMLDVFSGADRTMTAARPGAVARFVIERWLAGRLDREPGR